MRPIIHCADYDGVAVFRIPHEKLLVRPPAFHFFRCHVLDVIIPAHSAIKAFWVEAPNTLVYSVRARRKRELIIGLDPAIFGSPENTHLAATCRKLRLAVDNWSLGGRRGVGCARLVLI